MRVLPRTRETYIAAGATTLARQGLFKLTDVKEWALEGLAARIGKQKLPGDWGDEVITAMIASKTSQAKMAESLLTTSIRHAVFLVEQQAYPIMLAISTEDAEDMALKLKLEKAQLAILELLLIPLSPLNPLAWISYGNFVESFKAQIECHQLVLDHFNESWRWVTAKVTIVLDGDTIYVHGITESIRFHGIDCPEIWHDDDPWDPEDERYTAGRAAMGYTKNRLLFKTITIKLYTKRDLYGRRIGKIYLEGKSFETELVREGHAKFRYYG